MSKKILIITHHRENRSPGQRFRFEQYLSFLEKQKVSFDWDILLSEKDDKIFYSHHFFLKIILIIKLFFKRLNTLKKVKNYDGIFIFREAFVVGGAFFERQIAKRNSNIILDFDDAIWLHNVSHQNKKFAWLKSPSKTKDIIKISKTVITGNNYLANYAKKYCENVVVIPTTIDTEYHYPILKKNDALTISWTGSSSTLPYFENILPELAKLKNKYSSKIKFQVIVDENKYYPEIDTQTTPWKLESEIEDLAKASIGLMPLPDTEWAKGKCGFKALQYMSLAVPPVVSAIGVNTEIVKNEKNGFVIFNNSEWFEKIEQLILDETLRKQLGSAARKTIISNYSVEANKQKYLDLFNKI